MGEVNSHKKKGGEKMKRIRELREANNLTQEELAKKVAVSRTAVTKWETGECMPKTDKLIALATVFNCSIDYLLCNDE
jgi:transcriptional regulator with XRE-family HTH domain